MKFLKKDKNSKIIKEKLDYNIQSQRKRIRELLLLEQDGFCAYSERYAQNTDSIHIEHFDPRIKNTDDDNYENWYAVLVWMNEHKPKNIDKYLPILFPNSENIKEKIEYQDGKFVPINSNDIESKHLIDFLGFNKYELYQDRLNHIKLIRDIQNMCDSSEDFFEILSSDKSNLSFITALEVELGLNLSHLIN